MRNPSEQPGEFGKCDRNGFGAVAKFAAQPPDQGGFIGGGTADAGGHAFEELIRALGGLVHSLTLQDPGTKSCGLACELLEEPGLASTGLRRDKDQPSFAPT